MDKLNLLKFNNSPKSNDSHDKFRSNLDNYKFYDARETNDDTVGMFYDALEHEQMGLELEMIHKTTHVINTLKNYKSTNGASLVCTAPTVSAEAGLELLKMQELEVNLSIQDNQPIIIDTGASLAITGNKMDFLPNTYLEVNALKLGGMAAGAKIEGIGNVAWTFPCDNGDSLAIITKCYYVPSANTRLLSPQRIFDKQNGQEGRFWGDEDNFYLEYLNKPRMTINYSAENNLPIGYATTAPDMQQHQVNLSILDDQNQNLTAGQKLLLEYHYQYVDLMVLLKYLDV